MAQVVQQAAAGAGAGIPAGQRAAQTIAHTGGAVTMYTATPNREVVKRDDDAKVQAEQKDMSKHLLLNCGITTSPTVPAANGVAQETTNKPVAYISISLDPFATMPGDSVNVSGWKLHFAYYEPIIIPENTTVYHGQPLLLKDGEVQRWYDEANKRAPNVQIQLCKPGKENVVVTHTRFPVNLYDSGVLTQGNKEGTWFEVTMSWWQLIALFIVLLLCVESPGVRRHRAQAQTHVVQPIEAYQQLDAVRLLRTNETELQAVNPNIFATIEKGHLTIHRYLGATRSLVGSRVEIQPNAAPHVIWSMSLYENQNNDLGNKKFTFGFDMSGRLIARVQGSFMDTWTSETCDLLAERSSTQCHCHYMELTDQGKLNVYDRSGQLVMTLNDGPFQDNAAAAFIGPKIGK